MAVSLTDLSGASSFNSTPPAYHWVFIIFSITFGLIFISWLLPIPGVCFINILVAGTLFLIFIVLYFIQFNNNKQQYIFNLLHVFSDKFGIDLSKIYEDAVILRDSSSSSSNSNSSFNLNLNSNSTGFNDYAPVIIKVVN